MRVTYKVTVEREITLEIPNNASDYIRALDESPETELVQSVMCPKGWDWVNTDCIDEYGDEVFSQYS